MQLKTFCHAICTPDARARCTEVLWELREVAEDYERATQRIEALRAACVGAF